MSSEQRRKKQLEKKKAKRQEKTKERYERQHVPLAELPLKHAFINPDWKDARYAFIVLSRVHQDGGYEVGEFLIDCDGFGLNDCYGPRHFAVEEYDEFVRRKERAAIDPAAAAAAVEGAVAWANRFRFPLPKSARKALEILPPPGKSPIEYGRDGEPFLRGEEASIRQRLAQAGLHVENFNTEFFPSSAKKKTFGFASEERMRRADGNDPLLRLERMAMLADGYEQGTQLPKAEELHARMEELAGQCDCLPLFLKYHVAFLLRRERMEKALGVFERIVEVTADPEAKALAELDQADFMRYLGDALGADEIYQKAMRAFPRLWEAKRRHAAFLYLAARRDESVQEYRALIAALKAEPDVRETLGRAYQELYTVLTKEGAKADAKALSQDAKSSLGIQLR
jgi:tetratricopeptide (TPR) repeat protein